MPHFAACAGRDPAAPVEGRATGRDGRSPSLAPTQKRKVSLQAVSRQSQPQAVSKLREGASPTWAETAERGFGARKRIEPGAGTARAMIGNSADADIDDQDEVIPRR